MQDNKLRFLFLGDLIGKPGRALFKKWAYTLREQYKIDAIILNGENSADNGRGITPEVADFFFENGASVITTGNHIWAQKTILNYINEEEHLIRPANFPSSCPGKGYSFFQVQGHTVAVLNLQGRVFMHEHLNCPFKTAESLLPLLVSKTNIIFVDIHAEATSEKQGMGFFLDGKVSGVYGTHTHVQTADEKILPQGTSYISDLGFSGSYFSMLGMRKEPILERFLTQMPIKFFVEQNGPMVMTGIWVEVDTQTGRSTEIERILVLDKEIHLTL